MNKLTTFSITILTIAAVGLVVSVTMEAYAKEPIYILLMKVCAGLFGVGGPLLGWSIVRRNKKHRRR